MTFIDYFINIALLKDKNRILLEAEGGFGKTTSLKYLARKLLDSYEIVPIYVDCKDLSSYSVEEVIVHEYCGDDASCENFDKMLKSAKNIKFVFMFDSFNEVKEKTCNKVLDFCGRYESNQYSHIDIIIASRSVNEDHRYILKENGFQSLKFQALDANRVKNTVSEYLTTPSESLITILCNPMMLSIFLKAENKDAFSGVKTQAGLLEVYFEEQRRKIATLKKYILKEKNTFEFLICIALPLFFHENEGKYSFRIDELFIFIENIFQKCKESVFQTEYRKICLQNDINLSPALFKEFTTEFLRVFEDKDNNWVAHQIYADYFACKWYQKAIEAWMNTPSAVPQFVFCEYNHMQDYIINLVSREIARFLIELLDFNKVFDVVRSKKPEFEATLNAWMLNILTINEPKLETLNLSKLDLKQFDFHKIVINNVDFSQSVLLMKSIEPYIRETDYKITDFSILYSNNDIVLIKFSGLSFQSKLFSESIVVCFSYLTGKVYYHLNLNYSDLVVVNEEKNDLFIISNDNNKDLNALIINLFTGQVKYRKTYSSVWVDCFISNSGFCETTIRNMEEYIVIEKIEAQYHNKKAIIIDNNYCLVKLCDGDEYEELKFQEREIDYYSKEDRASIDAKVEMIESPDDGYEDSLNYDYQSILEKFVSFFNTGYSFNNLSIYQISSAFSLGHIKEHNIFIIFENKKDVIRVIDDFKTPLLIINMSVYTDTNGKTYLTIQTTHSNYYINLTDKRFIKTAKEKKNFNDRYIPINDEYGYCQNIDNLLRPISDMDIYTEEGYSFDLCAIEILVDGFHQGIFNEDEFCNSGYIIGVMNGKFYALLVVNEKMLIVETNYDFNNKCFCNIIKYNVLDSNLHLDYETKVELFEYNNSIHFWSFKMIGIEGVFSVYKLENSSCIPLVKFKSKNVSFLRNCEVRGGWLMAFFDDKLLCVNLNYPTIHRIIAGNFIYGCLVEDKVYYVDHQYYLCEMKLKYQENSIKCINKRKLTILLNDIKLKNNKFDDAHFIKENGEENQQISEYLNWYR